MIKQCRNSKGQRKWMKTDKRCQWTSGRLKADGQVVNDLTSKKSWNLRYVNREKRRSGFTIEAQKIPGLRKI
jgi:hypothetical protein